MKLAVTIDVEEEGLFRGKYERGDAPVENVSRLESLHPIFSDLGIRPTLLVSYRVASSARARDHVLGAAEKWKGEIGGHLHYWNTPPVEPLPHADPAPSEWITDSLLAAKVDTLVQSIGQMGVRPRSFRMGRFSMGSKLFSLLAGKGFSVDSSVAPGREWYGGPSHLNAPVDPYFPDPGDLCRPGGSRVLEAPVTIVPILEQAGRLLQALGRSPAGGLGGVLRQLQHLLFLPAVPAWTGLRRLEAAAALHRRRGGKVVTLLLHSSELMPGGYPAHKTESDVLAFLDKLKRFLRWLRESERSEPVTLSELRELYGKEPHA